jgi:hypothetical protein
MRNGGRDWLALTASLALAALACGCTATPTYTRTVTTLGEVDTTGLVCRRGQPTGSSIPRTICASQAAWDKQDAAEAAASARMHDEDSRHANVDPFGRTRN